MEQIEKREMESGLKELNKNYSFNILLFIYLGFMVIRFMYLAYINTTPRFTGITNNNLLITQFNSSIITWYCRIVLFPQFLYFPVKYILKETGKKIDFTTLKRSIKVLAYVIMIAILLRLYFNQ